MAREGGLRRRGSWAQHSDQKNLDLTVAFLLVVVESIWQLCFSNLHSTTSLQGISKLSLESRGVRQAPEGIQAQPIVESRITVDTQPD